MAILTLVLLPPSGHVFTPNRLWGARGATCEETEEEKLELELALLNGRLHKASHPDTVFPSPVPHVTSLPLPVLVMVLAATIHLATYKNILVTFFQMQLMCVQDRDQADSKDFMSLRSRLKSPVWCREEDI
jgi:hypothetical protein